MENNYVVYKIECKDKSNPHIYIGSTTNLKSRKWDHKKRYTQPYRYGHKLKLYETMRENGGWDNFEFSPIEELIGVTKLQAHIREQFWIDYYKPNLNSKNAFTDQKQYKEDNKERFRVTNKIRYEQIKDEINAKRREKYTCECGKSLRKDQRIIHDKSNSHILYIKSLLDQNSHQSLLT